MRTGNLAAYRVGIRKGAGLARRACDLMQALDAEAWLVALGAKRREYDLVACRAAALEGDDEALAEALGFGDQALRANVIDAPSTIYYQRAQDQRWVRTTEAPLKWLDELQPAPCASPLLAYMQVLVAKRDATTQRLCVGHDGIGVTELSGGEELAPPQTPSTLAGPVAQSPAEAMEYLAESDTRFLELRRGAGLTSLRLFNGLALDLLAVKADGTLFEVRLVYRGGWYMQSATYSGRDERLAAARDDSMKRILAAAQQWAKHRGRWPAAVNDLPLPMRDLVDATAGTSRLGWERYNPHATPGYTIHPPADGEIALRAVELGRDGRRRALTHKNELIWLDR